MHVYGHYIPVHLNESARGAMAVRPSALFRKRDVERFVHDAMQVHVNDPYELAKVAHGCAQRFIQRWRKSALIRHGASGSDLGRAALWQVSL